MISPSCNLTMLHLLSVSSLGNLYTLNIIVNINLQGGNVALVTGSSSEIGSGCPFSFVIS
jgi:hypothetical protein